MQVLILKIVVVALSISAAIAIECYDCNSHFDARCADPFKEYGLGKVNCDEKVNTMPPNTTATFCRKTYQKGAKFLRGEFSKVLYVILYLQ
jgi:hypothetical protein